MIDRSPEVKALSVDFDEHLIDVPAIAESTSETFKLSLIARAERQTPTSDRLVRDDDTEASSRTREVTSGRNPIVESCSKQ